MDASQKKIILIAIASLAALSLLAATGLYFYFKSQFIVYQDSQYKFSIEYPRTWQMAIHPRPNVAVAFLRPKDTALDIIRENFGVTIQPMPVNVGTLPAFTDTIRKQMTAVFGKSINIVEDKPFQWGWREGHLLAVNTSKPYHFRLINAWVIRGTQAYILTFLGDLDKYGGDRFVVDEMIHSFKLLQ